MTTLLKYTSLKDIAAIVVAMFFCGLHISAQKTMHLHFRNLVAGHPLYLDTATYTNAAGQKYTVTNFKYYISNISLTDDSGHTITNKDGYYLLRGEDASSMDIELNDIPAGRYKSISFMLGVVLDLEYRLYFPEAGRQKPGLPAAGAYLRISHRRL
jgi:hypothetical protein